MIIYRPRIRPISSVFFSLGLRFRQRRIVGAILIGWRTGPRNKNQSIKHHDIPFGWKIWFSGFTPMLADDCVDKPLVAIRLSLLYEDFLGPTNSPAMIFIEMPSKSSPHMTFLRETLFLPVSQGLN
jgi:hypothetical protein